MYKPLPLIISFVICLLFKLNLLAMDQKPYHHIYKDGKLFAFRNLENNQSWNNLLIILIGFTFIGFLWKYYENKNK